MFNIIREIFNRYWTAIRRHATLSRCCSATPACMRSGPTASRTGFEEWNEAFCALALTDHARYHGIEIHPAATIAEIFFIVTAWAWSSARRPSWRRCNDLPWRHIGRDQPAQDQGHPTMKTMW